MINFEVDSGANDNFIRKSTFNLLGNPKLQSTKHKFDNLKSDKDLQRKRYSCVTNTVKKISLCLGILKDFELKV